MHGIRSRMFDGLIDIRYLICDIQRLLLTQELLRLLALVPRLSLPPAPTATPAATAAAATSPASSATPAAAHLRDMSWPRRALASPLAQPPAAYHISKIIS